jgi:hypothetical protein
VRDALLVVLMIQTQSRRPRGHTRQRTSQKIRFFREIYAAVSLGRAYLSFAAGILSTAQNSALWSVKMFKPSACRSRRAVLGALVSGTNGSPAPIFPCQSLGGLNAHR